MSDNTDDMTPDEKRRDQLLRLSGSTEADAAPRIEVSEHDGAKRIDIADTAAVRPGPGPGVEPTDDPDSTDERPQAASGGGPSDMSKAGLEFDDELLDAEAEADDTLKS